MQSAVSLKEIPWSPVKSAGGRRGTRLGAPEEETQRRGGSRRRGGRGADWGQSEQAAGRMAVRSELAQGRGAGGKAEKMLASAKEGAVKRG